MKQWIVGGVLVTVVAVAALFFAKAAEITAVITTVYVVLVFLQLQETREQRNALELQYQRQEQRDRA